MYKNRIFILLQFFVIAILMLAACSGDGDVVATVVTADTEVSRLTSTGYTCPEPEFPTTVTSTELNLFVWTEYIPAEMIECFELVYGVKVNRSEYSSNEEMYDRLSAGGSNYDLTQPTDYVIARMTRQDLLQEFDHAKLPALKNFDPRYLDFEFDPGNKYSIPYLAGTDAIVVNTGAVENIPQSWADLWKREYAGRMVFPDDSRSVIGLTLLTLGYDVNTTDPLQLAEAREKLYELVPNIRLFDSDSPQTALLAGAVDLGMMWTGEAYLARQANSDIQYIFPTEGVILWQDNWSMLKDAPHPDAAYAWLNYINQPNIFWMVLRDFPYINPNTAAFNFARNNQTKVVGINGKETTLATLYVAYMASPITSISSAVIKNGHRVVDVGESTRLYDDVWEAVKNR